MKRFLFPAILLIAFWLRQDVCAQNQTSITFCAYNLKNYLQTERFEKGVLTNVTRKPEAEIEAIIGFLSEIQPDVLGVCEIGSDADLKDLQQKLLAKGIDLPHSERAFGGDPHRSLAILSRFPILERNSQHDLKYRIGDQIFAVNRGFLDVTIELRKGFELRCIGAHLKSKRPVPEADEMLMRRNEAHLLRRYLEKVLTEKPDSRLVVYGDFNEHKNEAALVELEGIPGKDLSLMDIRLQDSRGETWTHYWKSADVYSRFDYCFVNRALQGYVDKKASFIYDNSTFYDGSDHRPLVLKIGLKKN